MIAGDNLVGHLGNNPKHMLRINSKLDLAGHLESYMLPEKWLRFQTKTMTICEISVFEWWRTAQQTWSRWTAHPYQCLHNCVVSYSENEWTLHLEYGVDCHCWRRTTLRCLFLAGRNPRLFHDESFRCRSEWSSCFTASLFPGNVYYWFVFLFFVFFFTASLCQHNVKLQQTNCTKWQPHQPISASLKRMWLFATHVTTRFKWQPGSNSKYTHTHVCLTTLPPSSHTYVYTNTYMRRSLCTIIAETPAWVHAFVCMCACVRVCVCVCVCARARVWRVCAGLKLLRH